MRAKRLIGHVTDQSLIVYFIFLLTDIEHDSSWTLPLGNVWSNEGCMCRSGVACITRRAAGIHPLIAQP